VTEFRRHRVEWTPEKVSRTWGFYAESPAHRSQYFSAHSGGAIVDAVEREAGLRGRRVLDFGCGRGDLLAHLLGRGIAASGLEFDATSAAETEERFRGEQLFRGVTLARALPSALEAGSFDRIVLVEVVEHLLDGQLEPTLAEVYRLLAPRGRAIATTVNDEDLAASEVCCPDCGAIFHRWQHVRSFSSESLAAAFTRAGFRTLTSRGTYWGLAWPTRLRTRLRHPGRALPTPHLLYIGEKPAG
jgi:SAM-dependent methyltransferase